MENEVWFKKLGFYSNPFSIKPAAFHNEVIGYDLEEIFSKVESGAVIYVKGPMGVGKTTLLKYILSRFGGRGRVIYCSCNTSDRKLSFRHLLVSTSFFNRLFSSPAENMILLVDEAQGIKKQETAEILRFFRRGNFKSVVFFGTDYVQDKFVPDLQGLIRDNFKVLSRLKPEHAVELVRKRIGDLPLVSDSTIARVYRLSGYNPRRLLENFEDIFNHAVGRGAEHVSDSDIRAVIREPPRPAARVSSKRDAQPVFSVQGHELGMKVDVVSEELYSPVVKPAAKPRRAKAPAIEIKEADDVQIDLSDLKPKRSKKKQDSDFVVRTYEEEMSTIKHKDDED